jgi:hypothetical protein
MTNEEILYRGYLASFLGVVGGATPLTAVRNIETADLAMVVTVALGAADAKGDKGVRSRTDLAISVDRLMSVPGPPTT